MFQGLLCMPHQLGICRCQPTRSHVLTEHDISLLECYMLIEVSLPPSSLDWPCLRTMFTCSVLLGPSSMAWKPLGPAASRSLAGSFTRLRCLSIALTRNVAYMRSSDCSWPSSVQCALRASRGTLENLEFLLSPEGKDVGAV